MNRLGYAVVSFLVACSTSGVFAADPPDGPFRTLKEILQTVPASMFPADANGWTELKEQAINDVLKEKAAGRPAEFQIVVKQVQPTRDSRPEFQLLVVAVHGQIGNIETSVHCYFDPDQRSTLDNVKKGDRLVVAGTIYDSRIDGKRSGANFQARLYHSSVVPQKGKR